MADEIPKPPTSVSPMSRRNKSFDQAVGLNRNARRDCCGYRLFVVCFGGIAILAKGVGLAIRTTALLADAAGRKTGGTGPFVTIGAALDTRVAGGTTAMGTTRRAFLASVLFAGITIISGIIRYVITATFARRVVIPVVE